MEKIDLNTCESGDKLLSSQGSILEYIGKIPMLGHTYLDHVVRYVTDPEGKPYPKDTYGTRTNDGFVFSKKRMPETDHDIVKIIKNDTTKKRKLF